MQPSILAAVPPELQHLSGSAVMEALGRVLEEFMDKELLVAPVASDIVKLAAEALEKQFNEAPVNETMVNFDFGEGIANYRYDEGRWELVVKGPLDLSVLGGDTTSMVLNTGLLGIAGSGPSLVRGVLGKETTRKGRKRKLKEEPEPEELEDDF